MLVGNDGARAQTVRLDTRQCGESQVKWLSVRRIGSLPAQGRRATPSCGSETGSAIPVVHGVARRKEDSMVRPIVGPGWPARP